MFDEASEADMGLHFAKVGEELFDAVALPQRLEAVRPPDPNILRFILELHHPDEWGKQKPEYSTAASVKARKWECSRRIR